jgi:hypothetical protein
MMGEMGCPYDIIDPAALESERVKVTPYISHEHAEIYYSQLTQHPAKRMVLRHAVLLARRALVHA